MYKLTRLHGGEQLRIMVSAQNMSWVYIHR